MDIDRFTEVLDRLMEGVPPELLRQLNGGVSVSEKEHRRPGDPEGVYILAEYITDPYLGALILLYHGSFARLFAGEPDEVWEREMWETLRHELRHHVEGGAGVRDLDLEDLRELQRLRREAERPRRLRYKGRLPRRREE